METKSEKQTPGNFVKDVRRKARWLLASEKNTLSYLLKKPDHFHNDIYHEKKEQSLNDLLAGVIQQS